MGRRQPVRAGEREERLDRRTRVDEDGGAALLVADEVRVREVPGVEAAFDEHDGTLHRRAIAAS
jgi:hypothetical protein